jgi:hypothetical protein
MRITINVTRPMRTFLRTLLICLIAPAAVAFAQESAPRAAFAVPKDNPLSAWNKYMYGHLKMILLRLKNIVPPTSEQGMPGAKK